MKAGDGMKTKFWTFRAAAEEPTTGELLLYGPLSDETWFGDEVTPKQFHADLAALGDITHLKVMINSPGGDVFAGQAIYSMLTRHPAHVTVYIDGVAASAASFVAMAGDTVIMPKNAMMVVHNPHTIGMGDARDFRKLADVLDSIRETMIPVYAGKTGMDRQAIIGIMDAETWLTADEAVKQGFADQLEEKKAVAASLVRPGVAAINGQELHLSDFKNPPDFPEAHRDDAATGPTKREIEHALRDVGMAQSAAKAFVSRGFTEEASPRDVAAERARTEQERLRGETDRLMARIGREFAGVK